MSAIAVARSIARSEAEHVTFRLSSPVCGRCGKNVIEDVCGCCPGKGQLHPSDSPDDAPTYSCIACYWRADP